MSAGIAMGGLVVLLRMRRHRKSKDKRVGSRSKRTVDWDVGSESDASDQEDHKHNRKARSRYISGVRLNDGNSYDKRQLLIDYADENESQLSEWKGKPSQDLVKSSSHAGNYNARVQQRHGSFGLELPRPPYFKPPTKTQQPNYQVSTAFEAPDICTQSPRDYSSKAPSPSPLSVSSVNGIPPPSPPDTQSFSLDTQNRSSELPTPPRSPKREYDNQFVLPNLGLSSTSRAPAVHSHPTRFSSPTKSPKSAETSAWLPPPPPFDSSQHLFRGGEHYILEQPYEDPFVHVSDLGLGSVGAVEEVKTVGSSTGTCVRKKIFMPRHRRDDTVRRIQKEAKVLKSLNHVHIVRFLGSYERPNTYCLLMAPVGDNDLQAFLNQCSEQRARGEPVTGTRWLRKWFACLASALDYIHGQGVRHQDIKPSNIVHRGDTIYFTDFSSSCQFEVGQDAYTDSPSTATARYAAPEVADRFMSDGSLRKHGRGADIFALGCVFSEILTVILHESVATFYDFLLADTETNNGAGFLYRRKVSRIDEWFDQPWEGRTLFDGGYSPSQFFRKYIRPMLNEDRRCRPDAASVWRQMSIATYRAGSPTCSCTTFELE